MLASGETAAAGLSLCFIGFVLFWGVCFHEALQVSFSSAGAAARNGRSADRGAQAAEEEAEGADAGSKKDTKKA